MARTISKLFFPAVLCAALLILFAAIAWLAVRTKSPTYDEPYHAVSSWVQLHFHDYRIDNEDPPSWQYWAALPNGPHAIEADLRGPIWHSVIHDVMWQWYWGVQTLYRTPGNDAILFVARERAMMLVWGVALGGLICLWSWKIAGPAAAVVSTAMFCFDPNFLAHSALVKNDVIFAFSMFAIAYGLWKGGQNLTVGAIALILLCCIFTLTVKFSGVIAVLMVPLLLAFRAISSAAWPVLGRSISFRFSRLLIVAAVTVLAMAISYIGIWAVYGFRFQPTPQANVWLNLDELAEQTRINEFLRQYQGNPPPGAMPDRHLLPAVRLALYANKHGLLPQAFIAGFLFTYANALVRNAYLCGHLSAVGWWWYFPFAILVKTPVITLLTAAGGTLLAARALGRGRFQNSRTQWTAICLLTPPVVFLAWAMISNLNIGIRHVLVLYPFVFVAVGWAAGGLWNRRGRKTRIGLVMAGSLLAVESLSMFPNFIPYFNVAATSIAGGKIELLGDSNLDWGQDLPLLVQWQREHPRETLYLAYFGYADPAYYGIKYIPLPGGYLYDPPPRFPDPYAPCVLAISATNLQGFSLRLELRHFYAQWAKRKPIAVLGDSIYLFEYDPTRRNDER